MGPLRTLVEQYARALRDEPKLRAYAAASFIDDVGVAASTWATMLLLTNLFTSQRERAKLMLPSLACFLVGAIVSGPLADWAGRYSLARLARWRWRIVVWGRLAHAAALGVLALQIGSGAPTLARVLPFSLVAALMKTGLRATRSAFPVDLLEHASVELDADGQPMVDERGEPLRVKTYLLPMTSLIGALDAAATFGGLLVGGEVMALAAGHYGPLFFVNGVSCVVSAAVLFFFCHPDRGARGVSARELLGEIGAAPEAAPRLSPWGVFKRFGASLREGGAFLAQRKQRPLLVLLVGALVVEFVSESYDAKMMMKHILRGSDETVRYAEIAWSVAGILGVALLPALARRLGGLGRIFVVVMLIDGFVMLAAGRIAGAGVSGAILPFAVAMAADHGLTVASTSLTDLAMNSASSAAMRGRIAATYVFFAIVGDIFVEAIATPVSESIGIPAMLARVGVLQIVVVLLLAAWGGSRLLRYGLRPGPDEGLPA